MKEFVDIFKTIENEKNKWFAENDDNKTKEFIRTTLEAARINTVLRICGMEMEQRYWKGKNAPYWRIDHCNGRDGNSPIGNIITEAVKDGLKQLVKGFDRLSAEEIKQINNEVHSAYVKEYKNFLIRDAKKLAEEHAKKYIKDEIDKALFGDAEKVRLIMMDKK